MKYSKLHLDLGNSLSILHSVGLRFCNLLSSKFILNLLYVLSLIITLIVGPVLYYGFASQDNFRDTVFPWLQDMQLTTYTNITDFRAGDAITRGEAAKFMTQYANIIGMQAGEEPCDFNDIATYDRTLRPFVISSCQLGLFKGTNGNFLPEHNLTKSQALAVITRSLYGFMDENTTPWYSNYITQSLQDGILETSENKNLETAVTRQQIATWLYRASFLNNESIIYETEVDSADQCSSYETFDAEKNVCYFECTNESECQKIQHEIDTEIASWTDVLEDPERTFEEGHQEQNNNMLAIYSVSKGEKITLKSGTEDPLFPKIWSELAELSPEWLSNGFIDSFELYDDEQSDTSAAVIDSDNNGKWEISVNLAQYRNSDLKEQKAVFIHELAHIITLNNQQLLQTSPCKTYETDEGCASASSYLYGFVQKFWNNIKSPAFDESKFVTEYATTNQEEDIAESFAFYVLESNHASDTVRNQKLSYFNSYPELIALRKDMRATLSKYAIRMKKN